MVINMSNQNRVIVRQNHWRVPNPERAFDGWLEGQPSDAERLKIIANAEAARAAWKPSAEGMALVKTLKTFIGQKVQIQFWDSIMNMLEEEGPSPLAATIEGVILLEDGEHLQAYMEVSNVAEVPTPDGYSPLRFLLQRNESKHLLAPLSELYKATPL